MKKDNSNFNKSTLWTILCVAAVIILIAMALIYRDFFGFVLPNTDLQTPPIFSTQGDGISNLLPTPQDSLSDTESSEIISVTKENLRTVIGSIEPYDVYSWDFIVTTHSTGGALEEQNSLICNNGTFELGVSVGGKLQRTVIDDGHTVTVTEYIPYANSNSYPSSFTDVFSQGRLATPESFLNLPEDTVDFSCKLSKGIYGNIANLEFSYFIEPVSTDDEEAGDKGLLYRENYKISLDYGLVISAKTYENDVLIYELETVFLENSVNPEGEVSSKHAEDAV